MGATPSLESTARAPPSSRFERLTWASGYRCDRRPPPGGLSKRRGDGVSDSHEATEGRAAHEATEARRAHEATEARAAHEATEQRKADEAAERGPVQEAVSEDGALNTAAEGVTHGAANTAAKGANTAAKGAHEIAAAPKKMSEAAADAMPGSGGDDSNGDER